MQGPIHGLKFVHKAIAEELRSFEAQAAEAKSAAAIGAMADDLHFFREAMSFHHLGEEVGIFPLLDESSPGYAATYLFDHAAERAHLDSLCKQATEARTGDAIDLASFRRELSTVMDNGLAHIDKENTLLIPVLAERYSPPEQAEIVGKVVGAIPKEKMAALVPWIVARLDHDEAEEYVRGLMKAMPAPVFAAAKGWIRGGVPESAWAALQERIPELNS